MNNHFPREFEYEANKLKDAEFKKVDRQLFQVLDKVSVKDSKSFQEVEKVVEAIGRGEPVNSSGNA